MLGRGHHLSDAGRRRVVAGVVARCGRPMPSQGRLAVAPFTTVLVVHHLVDASPRPARGRGRRIRFAAEPERDRADRRPPAGHPEAAEDVVGRGVEVEEERAETGVFGGEEDEHRGERGVDGPVGDRPLPDRLVGERRRRLVRLRRSGRHRPAGRASDDDDDRRTKQRRPRSARRATRGRSASSQNCAPPGGRLEYEEIKTLGEPGRGRAQRGRENVGEERRGHRIGAKVARHAATPDRVVGLHRPKLSRRGNVDLLGTVCTVGTTAPQLRKSLRDARPRGRNIRWRASETCWRR